MTSNRQIHAVMADGSEIVRYDRAGKWYLERRDGHKHITLREAAEFAIEPGARINDARPGGQSFRAEVRKLEAGR